MARSNERPKNSSRGVRPSTALALTRLLRRSPIPLRELVKAIAADPAMTSLVLREAGAESGEPPPDVESAILLLGVKGLRLTLRRTTPAGRGGRNAGQPNRARIRSLRTALERDDYRIDPRAIASAMLRELERS